MFLRHLLSLSVAVAWSQVQALPANETNRLSRLVNELKNSEKGREEALVEAMRRFTESDDLNFKTVDGLEEDIAKYFGVLNALDIHLDGTRQTLEALVLSLQNGNMRKIKTILNIFATQYRWTMDDLIYDAEEALGKVPENFLKDLGLKEVEDAFLSSLMAVSMTSDLIKESFK